LAKVNAPLFSFNASGKIANALVYFGWKGIDVVRSYVIPTNPKSTKQTTQRDYMTAAVAAIHAAQALAGIPLAENDQIAYAQLGSTRPTPRTWFNEIVKLWLDCKVAAGNALVYHAGQALGTVRATVGLRIYFTREDPDSMHNCTFYLGKSKTSLIHAVTGSPDGGKADFAAPEDITSWAAVGDKIYWQCRPDVGDPAEECRSGIYSFIAT